MADVSRLSVIKVGGSLFDLPDLGDRLRRFVSEFRSERLLLFPGGGASADVVRKVDRLYRLGEEMSHWLALRALTINAYFLNAILPEFPVAVWPDVPERAILEPFAFAAADEKNADHLPHAWSVTSDSLAARAAWLLRADELILLKSAALERPLTWLAAAEAGMVDRFFPNALAQATGLRVRLVNFRDEPG